MMQRGQKSKERNNSVSLCKRVKTFVLLFVSLMFVVVGQASGGTSVQVTDTGNLIIKLVYPTEHLSLRDNGGDIGEMDIELNRGEYSGSLAGVRNISIIAWGTEKYIDVQGITISGDLTIQTGYEGDVISISRTSVRSNLKIVTGSGDDYIGINRMYVGERAAILTGAGADYVPLSNVYFSDTFRLLTGAGADDVSLSDIVFENHANVKTGGGDDVLLSTFVNTKGNARLFAGAGKDFVSLIGSEFDRNLTVYTGADNDILEMSRNRVSGGVVLGGASGLADVFQYGEQNEFLMYSEIQGFETYSSIGIESESCVINSCANYPN